MRALLHSLAIVLGFLVTQPIRAEEAARSYNRQLETPAERIVAVGSSTIVAIGNGRASLIDVNNGDVIETIPIPSGRILDATFSTRDDLGPAGFQRSVPTKSVTRSLSPTLSTQRVSLLLGDAARPLFVALEVSDVSLSVKAIENLPALSNPRMRVIGGSPVFWDKDAFGLTDLTMYQGGKPISVAVPFEVAELAPIGVDGVAFAVDRLSSQFALLDLELGDLQDVVNVGSYSAAPDELLAAFSPGSWAGGTGDVIIVAPRSGVLSVLSVAATKFSQRITEPLQISLSPFNEDALLSSTSDLSAILVSSRGSSEVHAFRKAGGGLEELSTFELDFSVYDVAALPSWVPGQEAFAFLEDEGRRLQVLSSADLKGKLAPEIIVEGDRQPTLLREGDIAGMQRVLAFLGYSVGAVDGRIGAVTTAALRAFQFDRKLPTTGSFDAETRGQLNRELIIIGANGRSPVSRAVGYQKFIQELVPGSDVDELLYLGMPQQSPSSKCFGLNSLPPKLLWPNSVGLAKILSALRERDLSVQVISAYRSSAYDSCVGASPSSSHLAFAAMDLVLPPEEKGNDRQQLIDALDALRGSIDVAFRVRTENEAFLHVELTGDDLVKPPTVFLQFAGGARTLAKELSTRLSDEGYLLPGEERVASAAGLHEVRYFHEVDSDSAIALAAAAENALGAMGYKAPTVRVVDMTNWAGALPAVGVLELWAEL